MISDAKQWYAVYTEPRCEKKVADVLTEKGIECYFPVNKFQKPWSDRKKIVYEPLFSAFVFVHIGTDQMLPVLQTHGVMNLVYWLDKPAVIRSEEIDIIKKFLKDYSCVRLEKTAVTDRANVLASPFLEPKPDLSPIKNKAVKVKLESLGYWMHADIETTKVKIIQGTAASWREPMVG
jgi:transcription antitermination factor NusG